MIDKYAKCLILVILMGWLIDARECAAATPFTPRHSDPVQEFWRWRAFPELKGQGFGVGIIYGQKKKARRSVMISGLLYGK